MKDYDFYGFTIPAYMLDILKRYINTGLPPGGFLTAVIENDLSGAVSRADLHNRANLPAYVGYLSNKAPAGCWGSPAKVKEWSKTGGMDGLSKEENDGK